MTQLQKTHKKKKDGQTEIYEDIKERKNEKERKKKRKEARTK